ncbi:primosomal protein N' [Fulvivirgaceae bacterium BMA10]|uniref:Replication restart protein PriA n=1 Tax=Splendidivirga corallicola TaxID=3051826 RepID=A0ABT8KP73_9BACT|nr:primosomal protein N' [Fulvivirgaceae bacterium BMA10]
MNKLPINVDAPEERTTLFADIILPVPIPKLFTYRVPQELNETIAEGYRVIVQFGKKKILTGVVGKVHVQPPKEYEAKYVLEVLDDRPVISPVQIKLFHWIAAYYICTIGEVLNVALPSGLKLSSQSRIQLNPERPWEDEEIDFSEKEFVLLRALGNNSSLTYDEAAEVLQQKSIYHTLKSLIQKEVVLLYEEVQAKYKPKKVNKVRLSEEYVQDEHILEQLFSTLEKKPKQVEILLKYLQEVPVYHDQQANISGLEKQSFYQAGLSKSSLNTLIKNKVFHEFEEIVSRFGKLDPLNPQEIVLSPEQTATRDEILNQFLEKDIVLLHGITGSGKTEIYIDLIKNTLENGAQVLYLLPEIALTTQIVKRLQKIFGDQMGIYHSKYSDNERVEVWDGVINGQYSFVVGVRSSIFLPFDNLGLIIVDEEHEPSYKQFDPAPRYHARDLALVLANMHHAKTLLGSATPSVESFFLAKKGKYGFVNLNKRYGESTLPEISIVDVLRERKKKLMREDFSSALVSAINDSLATGNQAIIFQNRRGYAPYIACHECNWIPKCESCAVSLTYHMYRNELRCHYCGYREKPHSACPACGSTKLNTVGFGTEKLEEDLKLIFPEAKVRRMDLDTTRSKYSYQNIIEEFEAGDIDILVGTQMVSKGLDFKSVNLVGILDVDRLLHFPDFRAAERTFQLVTQVSGRAGRRKEKGKVIIQTSNVDEPILSMITKSAYSKFFDLEILERKNFSYPPFTRLIKITVKNPDKKVCYSGTDMLLNLLREKLGSSRVRGPIEPIIGKIRNLFLMELLIKIERDKVNLNTAKNFIRTSCDEILTERRLKGTKITIDVDPY